LADCGADVILVEPPGGAADRLAGPFIEDADNPGHSLTFAYFNTSKQSVALDLDDAADRETFLRLADGCDAVLDGTGDVGAMAARGLGADVLRTRNGRLVYTSVSAFGADGPYAAHAASDTTIMALGGLLSLGGYAGGQPVRAFGDQALLAAGQFAAVGTMLALLSAEETGEGQFVDVSAQQSVVMANENAVQFYDLEKVVRKRNGGDVRQAGVGVYACADGHVYVLATGLGLFWNQLVAWLESEGIDGASSLRDEKWQSNEFAASPEGKAEFLEIFNRLAMNRTKAQLYDAAKQVRIPLCPVNDSADLVNSPHLKARDYFVEVPHPATGRTLTMPGAPFKLAASPSGVRGPAPDIGQHNAELVADHSANAVGGN
jgi:benzylsuccinate CoA-transferase BbsE subunit